MIRKKKSHCRNHKLTDCRVLDKIGADHLEKTINLMIGKMRETREKGGIEEMGKGIEIEKRKDGKSETIKVIASMKAGVKEQQLLRM